MYLHPANVLITYESVVQISPPQSPEVRPSHAQLRFALTSLHVYRLVGRSELWVQVTLAYNIRAWAPD